MDEDVPVCMSIIEPADCTNITSAMRALIGGFMSEDEEDVDADDDDDDDAEGSWQLAPYDINLLVRWYRKVQTRRGECFYFSTRSIKSAFA